MRVVVSGRRSPRLQRCCQAPSALSCSPQRASGEYLRLSALSTKSEAFEREVSAIETPVPVALLRKEAATRKVSRKRETPRRRRASSRSLMGQHATKHRPTPRPNRPATLKVLLVGADGCGKGSLCLRIGYLFDDLENMLDYVGPQRYNVERTVKHDDVVFHLDISVCNGHEDYDRLRPLSYPQTDVVLLCFSIDSSESLERLRDKFAREVRSHVGMCDVVLVGLRADLRHKMAANELVPRETARKLAAELGNERTLRCRPDRIANFGKSRKSKQRWPAPYLECSAKTGEGVAEVLEAAVAARMPKLPAHIDPKWNEYVSVSGHV